MELRRPRLADKETVLEMMAEFENISRLTTVVSGIQKIFLTRNGWKSNQNQEMGINLTEGWVPRNSVSSFFCER